MIRLSVNDTVVVDPGQDLQLSCDITVGFPAPTVTWVRYPGPLPLSALVRGPTLILRAVTPADAGFYNCTAVNNVGNPARKNVNVIVRSKSQPTGFLLRFSFLFTCSWFRWFLPDCFKQDENAVAIK